MITSQRRPRRGIWFAGLAVGLTSIAALALAMRTKQTPEGDIKCQCIKAPCNCGAVPDGKKTE